MPNPPLIRLKELGLDRVSAPQLAKLPDAVLDRAAKLKGVTVTAIQPYDPKTKREIAEAVVAQRGAPGQHTTRPVVDTDFRVWEAGKGGLLSATGKQYLDRVFSRWGQPPETPRPRRRRRPSRRRQDRWRPRGI